LEPSARAHPDNCQNIGITSFYGLWPWHEAFASFFASVSHEVYSLVFSRVSPCLILLQNICLSIFKNSTTLADKSTFAKGVDWDILSSASLLAWKGVVLGEHI
jgi:hypothetical protein